MTRATIIDESVFFLDIVEIAFRNKDDLFEVLRQDGRTPPDQRDDILDRFAQSSPPAVLLLSTTAEGRGLNITVTTEMMLCTPMSKAGQEDSVIGRKWHRGQVNVTTVYHRFALGCKVENNRSSRRHAKRRHNKEVMTRLEGTKNDIVPDIR